MSLRVRTFIVFLIAYALSYFLRSTNAVIADDLSRELSLSAEQLGIMTGLFFAGFAAVQLPLGQALDRFGARWVNSMIMLFAVIGAVIFGLAQNFASLALGRTLIGIGMASGLMGALKALSHLYADRQYAVISGIFVAFGALGALAAATPLAWLNEAVGWRPVFLWGAVALFLSSLAIWLFSRDEGSTPGKNEGSLVEVLQDLRIWRIACLNFAMAGSFFAYQTLWLGPYLRDVMGFSALRIGNGLLLLSLGSLIGYVLCGTIVNRFGFTPSIATAAFVILSMQLLCAFYQPTWSAALLMAGLMLWGFAFGVNIMFFPQVRSLFPEHMRGRCFTAINLFGFGGSAILQWLLGVIIGFFPETAAGNYASEAYRIILVFTAILILLANFFYLPLMKAEPKPSLTV